MREDARKNKDWAKADEIRGATAGMGYEIDDTSSGPKAHKI